MNKSGAFYVAICFLLTGWHCAEENGGGSTVINYQITASDLSGGWAPSSSEGTKVYPDLQSLNVVVNGDVLRYGNFVGCTETLVQFIEGTENKEIKAFIVSYTTEESAKNMLQARKDMFQDHIELAPYPTSIAICKPMVGGITVYAQIKNYYIELAIDGYGDDETLAKQMGSLTLGIYETKINN